MLSISVASREFLNKLSTNAIVFGWQCMSVGKMQHKQHKKERNCNTSSDKMLGHEWWNDIDNEGGRFERFKHEKDAEDRRFMLKKSSINWLVIKKKSLLFGLDLMEFHATMDLYDLANYWQKLIRNQW